MPQKNEEDAGDALPRVRLSQTGRRGRWWRPASRWGQALLAFCGLILLAAAFLGGTSLKTLLFRDARFRIEGASHIESDGLTEVSRDDLVPVFGEDIGRNIFYVPLAERRRQLERIPWIERATVMRLLPDRIRIAVVERKPVAFVRQGTQIGLVDGDGVLLTMPAGALAQHHYSFPVVTGIDANEQAPVRKGRMAVYRKLMAELDANNRKLSEQVSEIDLSNPDNLRLQMSDQGGEITADFGADHFLQRFDRYKEFIAAWRRLCPSLSAVDLRYGDRVHLKTCKGTEGGDQVVENGASATPPAAHGTLEKAAAKAAEKAPAKKPVKPESKLKSASSSKSSSVNQKAGKSAGKAAKTSKSSSKPGLKTAQPQHPTATKSAGIKRAALVPAQPHPSRPAHSGQEQ